MGFWLFESGSDRCNCPFNGLDSGAGIVGIISTAVHYASSRCGEGRGISAAEHHNCWTTYDNPPVAKCSQVGEYRIYSCDSLSPSAQDRFS